MKLTKINPQELKKLAEKIQLKIEKEEMANYLATFQELTKSINKFSKFPHSKRKIKLDHYLRCLWGKKYSYLTLSELKKIKSRFSSPRINCKTLRHNAHVTSDGFIFYPYKS